MSGSYFAQWIASIDTGHVITKDDMATLARIRLALHNADKHHRQARAAQAILAALREPSDMIVDAVRDRVFALSRFDDILTALRTAVTAAELEVGDEHR